MNQVKGTIREAVNATIKAHLDSGLINPQDFIKGRYFGQKSDIVELVANAVSKLGYSREFIRNETVGMYLRKYRASLRLKARLEGQVNNTIKF